MLLKFIKLYDDKEGTYYTLAKNDEFIDVLYIDRISVRILNIENKNLFATNHQLRQLGINHLKFVGYKPTDYNEIARLLLGHKNTENSDLALRCVYAIYNEKCFRGSLSKDITVKWGIATDTSDGTQVVACTTTLQNLKVNKWFRVKKAESITLNPNLVPRDLIDMIMLHEMIHLFCSDDGHNGNFIAHCKRIKRLTGHTIALGIPYNKRTKEQHDYCNSIGEL